MVVMARSRTNAGRVRGGASRTVDIVGSRFGRLVVLGRAMNRGTRAYWSVQCECGFTFEARGSHLRAGNVTSCGCLRREQAAAQMTTHGHGNPRGPSPTYNSWRAAVKRTEERSNPSYPRYGGRGIRVCRRWRESFAAFLADMGMRPAGKTLDRIETDAHYSCGSCEDCAANGWTKNCRWATAVEQAANRTSISSVRSITFKSTVATVREWSEITGVPQRTIKSRLRRHPDDIRFALGVDEMRDDDSVYRAASGDARH